MVLANLTRFATAKTETRAEADSACWRSSLIAAWTVARSGLRRVNVSAPVVVAGDERGDGFRAGGEPVMEHRRECRSFGHLVEQGCPLGLKGCDVVGSQSNIVAFQRFTVTQGWS
jgi:hypothetical protein